MRRILSFLISFTFALQAQSAEDDEQANRIRKLISNYETQLKLDQEQLEKMESVVRITLNKQREILTRYGIEPGSGNVLSKLGLFKARKLSKEISAIKEEERQDVSSFLSHEQLQTYDEIQIERRQNRRSRWKKQE
jgi:hypothetical protein